MAYEDLLKDSSKPDPDNKNYFIVTITDLVVDKQYPIQFRWKYKDGTFGPWSVAKKISVSSEVVQVPSTPAVTAGPGRLNISWNGNNSSGTPLLNIDRINVLVNSVYYGSIIKSGSAGSLTLAFPIGSYSVTFIAVSKLGNESSPSSAATATITQDIGGAYTALSNKLEAGAGVIANAQSQIISMDTGSGLVIYSTSTGGSSTSGHRVVLNSEGLAGFNTDNKATFAILTLTKYYDVADEKIYSTNAAGRLTIDAGSGFFAGTLNAKAGVFSGALTVGDGLMKFGDNVNGSNTGIYINPTNYWYDTGSFKVGNNTYNLSWDTSTLTIKGDLSFGNADYLRANGEFSFGGILTGQTDYVAINLNNGLAGFYLLNIPLPDDDGGTYAGYAGYATTVIDASGKIRLGRRIIHNSTVNPTIQAGSWSGNSGLLTDVSGQPTNRAVRRGDIIMVGE